MVKDDKEGREGMAVEAVPSSKGDIFRSSLGLLEKRRYQVINHHHFLLSIIVLIFYFFFFFPSPKRLGQFLQLCLPENYVSSSSTTAAR